MNHDEFTETTESLPATGEDAVQRAKNYAQGAANEVRSQAGQALAKGEAYARENPVPVVLGALGIGILIGLALGQRHEPTARERYVDEPLNQARELLHSLLAPVAKSLREQYGQARSAAQNAADSVSDLDPSRYVDPLLKEAGRTARKFKFW
ncbi:MAG: hypothetical protein QOE70_2287 [Chthoniobacter sp.]|jgi:ElaB/YqjD/DUF883 family membrane-anchored ribosome-binding protein|nr:hypothetical protein [Chthoniobacter sp.]